MAATARRASQRQGVDRRHIVAAACLGFPLFFLNGFLLSLPAGIGFQGWSYTLTLGAGYLSLLAAGVWLRRLLKQPLADDRSMTAMKISFRKNVISTTNIQ